MLSQFSLPISFRQFRFLTGHAKVANVAIYVREHRQLGFAMLNCNLAINLKSTHPHLLNAKGQFSFLKTKLSHSSSTVVYPPKFEFLRN